MIWSEILSCIQASEQKLQLFVEVVKCLTFLLHSSAEFSALHCFVNLSLNISLDCCDNVLDFATLGW